MKFGSVCSGIEAASIAWNPLGWRAEFVSEIDRFPCEVLEHHHGSVPNRGDMTKFKDWPDATIDVLVGGTPCQSFSVAGLRKGLDDPCGNLMLTYLAIAARYRPEWLVWENVSGVLSSSEGRDFGSLLGGLGELGYGFAYRILDAQYFNLAQRRQRVFVVGCLGGWRRAAAVLFERASLRGDSAPSRETGQSPAASLTSGSHPGSNAPGRRREDDINLVSDTVRSHPRPGSNSVGNLAFSPSGHAGYSEGGGTLRSHGGDLGGGSETLLARPLLRGGRFNATDETLVTHSLRADGFDASEDGTGRAGESTLECRDDGLANAILTPNGGRGGIGVGAVAFNARQDPDAWIDRTGPLDTDGTTQAVAFHENQRAEVSLNNTAGSLKIGGGKPGQGYPAAQNGLAVRRLTPRECERLQGFPTVISRVTITGCLDHQKTSVNVALQCRRLPSNALNAAGEESSEYVSPADFRLQNDRDLHDSLVALHVRIGFAPKLVALHSQGKWRLSADNAVNPKWSPLLTPQDSFAHALVALWRGVAPVATDGKEGSPPSTLSFTLPVRGNWLAAMFGQENAGFASAVSGAQAEATTYTTSNHGRDMRRFDWIDQTSRSFVLNAIASCIQEKTKPANSFSAVVDFETDYTLITRKGKSAADGPRYKALGNSMAVPVMAWIGRRIQQCSTSTSTGEP